MPVFLCLAYNRAYSFGLPSNQGAIDLKTRLRVATRKSPLALWQANHIGAQLAAVDKSLDVELVELTTKGDRILDAPLAKVGGKGLFVKELEQAMLEDRADIAVHSTKDVPMVLPPGLVLGAICQRDDPHDALVLPPGKSGTITSLPAGSRVGTSSLRRRAQLQRQRPDLKIFDLRGNIHTRLDKLDAGNYDAIILAASGLQRMGMSARITGSIPVDQLLPAVAQGALSIECRDGDEAILSLIASINDVDTARCINAERAMNRALNGGCQVPIAGYATLDAANTITLRGRVGSLDGSKMLEAESMGGDPEQVGADVAAQLLDQGAAALLEAAHGTE